jgi:quinol monooxygenase YgiN
MTPSSVTVVIEYRAQSTQVQKAMAELDDLIATVVAVEVDCFGIRLLQDPADPARFLLYEQWSSREAYLGPHFQTPHLQDFIARAPEFMAGPPVIQFWHERSAHTRG